MNAPHEEAVEFAKISKRENRVYVGNLSYDVKYRDLMEFMRGGGLGNLKLVVSSLLFFGNRLRGGCVALLLWLLWLFLAAAAEEGSNPMNCSVPPSVRLLGRMNPFAEI
jgi:hypothetical protein